jgi:hypothetical protein
MKPCVQWVAYPLGIVVGLLGLCLSSDSQAAETAMRGLPRSFEGAQLGMPQSTLVAQARGIGRVVSKGRSALVIQPKDPHLAQIEYRFHRGAVRQIDVKYKSKRIPGGYEALVGRLKDIYGPPQQDGSEELDPRPDVLSLRKTMWMNPSTEVVITETRRIQLGEEPSYDLVLSLTDRALEQAYREDQVRRQRREVSRIPIPLPDDEQATKGKSSRA